MRVKFIVSCASNDCAFSGGREYDLPEDRAKQYVAEGLAVLVEHETKLQRVEKAINKTTKEKR